ncbi:hypothetical protein AXF15_10725 [Desulfomicrobium orale DSM 12838]|uniref:Uncharacterized protein n=1 Tax=Desulfomicrobium orale DSM 12838 TaxID=888061 RepID=A0A0X8JR95_9BACT|nr:hypothetical protein AXF15_10725 [Desulfomicrobium orale DSM 12838]
MVAFYFRYQCGDMLRVMLPVSIKLNNDVVVFVKSVLISCLQRSPVSCTQHVIDDIGVLILCNFFCFIIRAIIYYQNIQISMILAYSPDYFSNIFFLIV